MPESRGGLTLTEPGRSGIEPRASAPHLFVALECDRPLAGPSRHSLADLDLVTIGRGAARAVARDGPARRLELRVPGGFMSSAHGRLVRDGEQWIFEDAGSRNGCFLNGAAIERAALRDGDLLELGHTMFIFRRALTAAPPADSSETAAAPAGLATTVPALEARFAALAREARGTVSLLLLGETGTGKEVTARAVHALSGRPGAFVPVNCAALPESLIESLLFGHTKGAFSGATRDEPGFVRAADRGTLFLDEIGDLPLAAQGRLLRVLQEREVQPVGSPRSVSVDLRVVAATHRKIDRLAALGEFRADLFARLAGGVHELAPLRERREDLGLLIAALLPRVAGERAATLAIDPGAAHALFRHAWPHNVRELEKCLEVAVLHATDGRILASHLPTTIADSPRSPGPREPPVADGDEALRGQLQRLLERHRGNIAEVARELRKDRNQVYRWLRRLRIDPEGYREG